MKKLSICIIAAGALVFGVSTPLQAQWHLGRGGGANSRHSESGIGSGARPSDTGGGIGSGATGGGIGSGARPSDTRPGGGGGIGSGARPEQPQRSPIFGPRNQRPPEPQAPPQPIFRPQQAPPQPKRPPEPIFRPQQAPPQPAPPQPKRPPEPLFRPQQAPPPQPAPPPPPPRPRPDDDGGFWGDVLHHVVGDIIGDNPPPPPPPPGPYAGGYNPPPPPGWFRPDYNYVTINTGWGRLVFSSGVQPMVPEGPRPYWYKWSERVRKDANTKALQYGWFSPPWWTNHPPYATCPWWSYRYWPYPCSYWWRQASWNDVNGFYPGWWAYPQYYDYGPHGSVSIRAGQVFINNRRVCSEAEMAYSAAAIATVPNNSVPPTQEQRNRIQWLPLGTFAISTSPVTPSKACVQLVASNDGLISGTLFSEQTNQTFPIEGRIDRMTQRVCFCVVGTADTIMETGIYNLTQNEVPMLIHKGPNVTEVAQLVRLFLPQDENTIEFYRAAISSPQAADNSAQDTVNSIF